MNSVPDWNAMALVLDDIAHGNKGLHSASDVLTAAFGDTVLFVINVVDEGERIGGFLKVWPLEGTDDE